ncbi:MAG: TSUP family transporter, partial [SAR86 cluster bacterium]
MDASLSITGILALLTAGVIGGFINTLAGGGSMLTLPALMLLGMPADIANATNRVGVLFQSLAGVKGFKDQDKLDSSAIGPVLIPTLLGALVGSLFAAYLPVGVLKPILLGTMV